MRRQHIDQRSTESERETRERFLRVLAADVVWWRENASAVPTPEMKTIAYEVAAEMERVRDHLRSKWHM